MTRHQLHALYVARATETGSLPKPVDAFRTIQDVIDATEALPPLPLSGKVGYIHRRFNPAMRSMAREWFKSQDECPVNHEHRRRWNDTALPVELCRALIVRCYPRPRTYIILTSMRLSL
jgi:hypothetical protein